MTSKVMVLGGQDVVGGEVEVPEGKTVDVGVEKGPV